MSEPLIERGLAEAEYRAAEGIANSDLKHMEQSPAHYRAHMLAKGRPHKPTPAQVFGSVLHGALLEPERVLHVIRPEGMSFQTKEGKAWRDAQRLPILTEEEDAQVRGARTAALSHPLCWPILQKADKEVSVWRTCPETGLLLKGRLDLVFSDETGRTIIADIKTCDDASVFSRDARKWGYHRQAAYYLDLLGASAFLFIAVEKTAPHGIRVFQIMEDSQRPDDLTIKRGRATYRADLAKVRECKSANHWPSYPAEIEQLEIRPWKEAA